MHAHTCLFAAAAAASITSAWSCSCTFMAKYNYSLRQPGSPSSAAAAAAATAAATAATAATTVSASTASAASADFLITVTLILIKLNVSN